MSVVNRALQAVARPFGYAVVLQHLDKAPAGALSGSKVDYVYLDRIDMYLRERFGLQPRVLFEVGANYAQDALYLSELWSLDPADVYVFEPHPQIVAAVRAHYPFQAFDLAVSDSDATMTFSAVRLDVGGNSGISSLRSHSQNTDDLYQSVTVATTRLDTFMAAHDVPAIDFLKIDVEGATFEVLAGLGERIRDVKAIQVETEYVPVWEGQRTQSDVYALLGDAGFQLVEHFLNNDGVQADSLWVRSDVVPHRVYSITRGEWSAAD